MKTRALRMLSILPVFIATAAGSSDGGSDNALALLNAYLAQAARTAPEYRADLRPKRGSEEVPAGRLPGYSPFLGSFTYRPKTYRELSVRDRVLVLREPEFHAFLKAACKRGRPPPGSAPFLITPEEMLRPQSFRLALPSQ